MIKKIISKIYSFLFNSSATLLPIKKNQILFESFNGKLPGDNPLAIYNEVIKEIDSRYLYWGVKKQYFLEAKTQFPELNFVSRFSFKWIWVATRAHFWVFNARMPHWLKKNKKTTYIQTWHGTPLKRLGVDIPNVAMPGTDTSQYKKNFIYEANRWDYLIAPNKYSQEIFKTAFQFKNTFLTSGYPRNDELVIHRQDTNYQNELKQHIIGKTAGRVILYAPTWRDDYYISKGNYKFFMPFELSELLSQLDQEDTLIIRPHYLVSDSIDISGYEDRVKICVSEDINQLYLISDLLITDYSSVMFDYSLLKRPMLFYPYDMDHYAKDLRGFYFEYSEVPGPIALTEKNLFKYLKEFVENGKFTQVHEKEEQFYQLFNSWEQGAASNSVVNVILNGK
jgi:Putative glycosyl/glycerophosphate transferases involved in teichoic acid biosynthesis TagF/TagB/EpsJ/RodC